jgi:hypothetical protein
MAVGLQDLIWKVGAGTIGGVGRFPRAVPGDGRRKHTQDRLRFARMLERTVGLEPTLFGLKDHPDIPFRTKRPVTAHR